jgi:hypothetical protein
MGMGCNVKMQGSGVRISLAAISFWKESLIAFYITMVGGRVVKRYLEWIMWQEIVGSVRGKNFCTRENLSREMQKGKMSCQHA